MEFLQHGQSITPSPEEREQLLSAIEDDERLEVQTHAYDRFQFLLVLLGERPACDLAALATESTPQAAEVRSSMPVDQWETNIYPFLKEHGIPFKTQVTAIKITQQEYQVFANYHISFDRERLDSITDHLRASPWDSPTRREHVAMGRFFGFPDSVVHDWCETPDSGQTFFESLPDSVVREEMSEFDVFFEAFGLPPSRFVDYVLPYYVPASSINAIDQAISDARQFIASGLRLWVEYDCHTFLDFITQFKNREGVQS